LKQVTQQKVFDHITPKLLRKEEVLLPLSFSKHPGLIENLSACSTRKQFKDVAFVYSLSTEILDE
jgi:hypothetical protein